MIILTLLCVFSLISSPSALSSPVEELTLKAHFKSYDDSPVFLASLKEKTLQAGVDAVPTLIQVMKGKDYTDKKKWMATLSIGKIMGKKSIKFIQTFANHPNWILRLAGLKTLLHLKDHSSKEIYRQALKDPSLIVRMQAIENIRSLGLKDCAQDVWKILFYPQNYQGTKGQRKRLSIVGKAIRAMGDLQYKPTKKALLKLANSKKYQDLSKDIQYALKRIP